MLFQDVRSERLSPRTTFLKLIFVFLNYLNLLQLQTLKTDKFSILSMIYSNPDYSSSPVLGRFPRSQCVHCEAERRENLNRLYLLIISEIKLR